MSQIHDHFVKASLMQPGAVQEFASLYFPKEILRKMDISSLQLTSKSYVTQELKELHNDLVFSFKVQEQDGYAFFLLEHQSTPDRLMPLRFIKYNLALIEDYLKENKKGTLPLIVNICLYHNPDEKPYPYSNSVYDLFENSLIAENLGIFSKFHLVDLNTIPDKILEEHKHIHLMEKLLKYSRHRDAFNLLKEELERADIHVLLEGEYWKTVLIYFAHVIGSEGNSEEKVVTLFKEVLSKDKEEIMTTIAQVIEKRGMEKGIQQGMQARELAIAKNMLKLNLDVKLIQEATGLSEEIIENLKQE